MQTAEAIKLNLDMGEYVSLAYLGDLTAQRPPPDVTIRIQSSRLVWADAS